MSDHCSETLGGPGPECLLVPHGAGHSPLRIVGDRVSHGTSYPTGLNSALSAHTFQYLIDPIPDLVRAFILIQTDLEKYDIRKGWGTPHHEFMPWNYRPGTVTLAWRAMLKPGYYYFWEEIPIPSQIIKNDRLRGFAALTVIHRPLVNDTGGPSYFCSRIGASLQYERGGDTQTLVGIPEDERLSELDARQKFQKWQPVRRNVRNFTRIPLGFNGGNFRLHARLFTRNLQVFNWSTDAEVPDLDATFVLTLSDGTDRSDIYDAMAVSLGNFVVSAAVDQDIEIAH